MALRLPILPAHLLPLQLSHILSLFNKHLQILRAKQGTDPDLASRFFLAINLTDAGTLLQVPSFYALKEHMFYVTSWGAQGKAGRVHGDLQEVWLLKASAGRWPPAWGTYGRALSLFQDLEVLVGSGTTGTLTGEREEAVEGAAAQLILV